jgi:hypothetical protein
MNDATQEVQPTLVLDFGDGEAGTFKAHRQANNLTLIENADNVFSDSPYESIKAVTVLVQDQVLDEELPQLREYLHQHGRDENYATVLYEALEKCWSGETGLPLEPSSDSSDDTETPEPEPSSTEDSSSPATPAPEERDWYAEHPED